jgi:hypothetical protein
MLFAILILFLIAWLMALVFGILVSEQTGLYLIGCVYLLSLFAYFLVSPLFGANLNPLVLLLIRLTNFVGVFVGLVLFVLIVYSTVH